MAFIVVLIPSDFKCVVENNVKFNMKIFLILTKYFQNSFIFLSASSRDEYSFNSNDTLKIKII